MELAIKIFAYLIIAFMAIAAFAYVASILVEAVTHADTQFPSKGKSELNCRDRYEVADKIKKIKK